MTRFAAGVLVTTALSLTACRDASAPGTAPLSFKLAANCPAFDADRSWTFFVDDQPVAEAMIGSGAELTVQVSLGNRKVAWRWNRASGAVASPSAQFVTAVAGGTNAVRIGCQ